MEIQLDVDTCLTRYRGLDCPLVSQRVEYFAEGDGPKQPLHFVHQSVQGSRSLQVCSCFLSGILPPLSHFCICHLTHYNLQMRAAPAILMGLPLGHRPHTLGGGTTICFATVNVEPRLVHVEVVLSIGSC